MHDIGPNCFYAQRVPTPEHPEWAREYLLCDPDAPLSQGCLVAVAITESMHAFVVGKVLDERPTDFRTLHIVTVVGSPCYDPGHVHRSIGRRSKHFKIGRVVGITIPRPFTARPKIE